MDQQASTPAIENVAPIMAPIMQRIQLHRVILSDTSGLLSYEPKPILAGFGSLKLRYECVGNDN